MLSIQRESWLRGRMGFGLPDMIDGNTSSEGIIYGVLHRDALSTCCLNNTKYFGTALIFG